MPHSKPSILSGVGRVVDRFPGRLELGTEACRTAPFRDMETQTRSPNRNRTPGARHAGCGHARGAAESRPPRNPSEDWNEIVPRAPIPIGESNTSRSEPGRCASAHRPTARAPAPSPRPSENQVDSGAREPEPFPSPQSSGSRARRERRRQALTASSDLPTADAMNRIERASP